MQSQEKRLKVLASHLIADNSASLDFQKVCGIIGVISHEPVSNLLMDGLKIMVWLQTSFEILYS